MKFKCKFMCHSYIKISELCLSVWIIECALLLCHFLYFFHWNFVRENKMKIDNERLSTLCDCILYSNYYLLYLYLWHFSEMKMVYCCYGHAAINLLPYNGAFPNIFSLFLSLKVGTMKNNSKASGNYSGK